MSEDDPLRDRRPPIFIPGVGNLDDVIEHFFHHYNRLMMIDFLAKRLPWFIIAGAIWYWVLHH